MAFGTSKKGQAALDFLMTYGWAIALVVMIAAVLFALGIFDFSNFVGNKASGFSGVAVSGWNLNSAGTMTMQLTNQAGKRLRIDSVNVTIGQNSSSLTGLPVSLNNGKSTVTLSTASAAFGPQSPANGYTAKVLISYTDIAADFAYTTSGTLTGRVS